LKLNAPTTVEKEELDGISSEHTHTESRSVLKHEINEELGGIQRRIKRTMTKWKLETSEIGFTKLEGCAIGDWWILRDDDGAEGVTPNPLLDMTNTDLEESEEDLNEWV
jgi:hypothetical protein